MLYQLSYSRGECLVRRNYAKELEYQPANAQPLLRWPRMREHHGNIFPTSRYAPPGGPFVDTERGIDGRWTVDKSGRERV